MSGRATRLALSAVLLAALCALAYALGRPPPPAPEQPELFLWTSDAETVSSIGIVLPRDGLAVAFARKDGGAWHFADPVGEPVEQARWAGIPLLASGVRVDRQVAAGAAPAALSAYGFDSPALRLQVGYADGARRTAEIGDETPSGSGDYIRAAGSGDVFVVSPAWRDVLRRLVTEPPHKAAG